MILHREARVGLGAARPYLVLSAAPLSSGGYIPASPAGAEAGACLAQYAGIEEKELEGLFDFESILPAWPSEVTEGFKWEGFPDPRSWEVGQRASLLLADLHERPRRVVVVLGEWTGDVAAHWLQVPKMDARLFDWSEGPGGCAMYVTPHPSDTNMWRDDPKHRKASEAFWRKIAREAASALPRAPRKVKASVRSQWLLSVIEKLESYGWPDECVDWPWLEPIGQRPAAYYRGEAAPASHVALEATGQSRPSDKHQALHSCDRGEHCVSAAHLRWGTELENRLDQSARARGDIGKVGLEKARAIRRELEELSARTGVPMDAIQRIAGGRSWAEESWTEETT